jgi:DNA-binding NtrC family response regulator
MKNLSSLMEKVLKNFSNTPQLSYTLSNNLEFRLLSPVDPSKPFKEARKIFLKNYLNDLLILSLGNVSLAAKKANINRRHLHRIINELEIDPESHRKEMIKPAQYLKENVKDILEETLSNFSKDDTVRAVYSNIGDISNIIAQNMDTAMQFDEALELFEKDFFTKALKYNKYDISKTAEAIDVSERTLYRKISKLNLAIA